MLYHLATHENLFCAAYNKDGFPPFFVDDSGYPLLLWLLTPHRRSPNPFAIDTLYNWKLQRVRGVVENAFGILKQSWRELLLKSELDVAHLPDVILSCCLLHNLLLGQASVEVEVLLEVLSSEGWTEEVPNDDDDVDGLVSNFLDSGADRVTAQDLQFRLGLHLASQCGLL
jgi:hypothetical protein